jgi:hypothetical protein
MAIIIPLWFYEAGTVMCFFGAVISLLLTFFSFRLFNYTRRRSHMLLALSFVFMSIGFIIFGASTAYSLLNFEQCQPSCVITRPEIFDTIVMGNYIYYAASLAGYSLFLLSYMVPDSKRGRGSRLAMIPMLGAAIFFQGTPALPIFQPQPTVVLYPFETILFQPFNIISSIILVLAVAKTLWGCWNAKKSMSLMVPAGFAAILVYHLMMIFMPVSAIFYAIAHLSLLAGFSILLMMLIRVTRK